jgi:hypothetical protein
VNTTTQKTHNNNSHNKTLHHHHKLGEEPNKPLENCAVVTNDEPHQKSRPAASTSNKTNSSAKGPSPSSRTHTVGDPSDPTKLPRKAPFAAPKKTTDPGLSAWGPRLFHRLTPLPRTQITEAANRATPPPNRCRSNHRTKRTALRPSAPKGPLHHPANTGQAPLQPPRANKTGPPPPLPDQGGSRYVAPPRRARRQAPSSHVPRELGFHPENPVKQKHDDPQWCPNRKKRRPQEHCHHCHRPVKAFTR